jgi:hypothetical protein
LNRGLWDISGAGRPLRRSTGLPGLNNNDALLAEDRDRMRPPDGRYDRRSIPGIKGRLIRIEEP